MECQSEFRKNLNTRLQKEIPTFPTTSQKSQNDHRTHPHPYNDKNGRIIKEARPPSKRPSPRPVAVEMPVRRAALSQYPDTEECEMAARQSHDDTGRGTRSIEENDSDSNDDEGDGDYIASENDSDTGDRVTKRRRISTCSSCKRPGARTQPTGDTDGANRTSISLNQGSGHDSVESAGSAGKPTLPLNDILTLASVVASAVVEQLTGYSLAGGEFTGRKIGSMQCSEWPKHDERLRDRGGKATRWSSNEDAQLLAMKGENCPWSEIKKRFAHRSLSSLRQRWWKLREKNVRNRNPMTTRSINLNAHGSEIKVEHC